MPRSSVAPSGGSSAPTRADAPGFERPVPPRGTGRSVVVSRCGRGGGRSAGTDHGLQLLQRDTAEAERAEPSQTGRLLASIQPTVFDAFLPIDCDETPLTTAPVAVWGGRVTYGPRQLQPAFGMQLLAVVLRCVHESTGKLEPDGRCKTQLNATQSPHFQGVCLSTGTPSCTDTEPRSQS